MAKFEQRLSVAIDDDMGEQLNDLKRRYYWDKTMGQLVRDLLVVGINAFEHEQPLKREPVNTR